MKAHSLPWWASAILALIGGSLLDASAPALSWWPAGIIGAAFIFAALWQQRVLWGALWGAVAGAVFWGPHISWLTLYLGPIPWLALCAVMVIWFALFGAATAFVTSQLGLFGHRLPLWAIALVQAVAAAGLWVAREQVQSTWPYGGFAWGRLAHSLAEAPGVGLVSWLGFAGTSGVMALLAATVVASLFARQPVKTRAQMWGQRWPFVLAGGATVLAVLLMTLTPAAHTKEIGELRIAAVQGNSKSAIFDDRESGDVLRDHIKGTERLLDELEVAGEQVDIILWPENSAEFDVTSKFYQSQAIEGLAQRADAPIVIGTILPNADGTYSNSSVVYDSSGLLDVRYDKRRPVPFAEYMPNRDFFRALVPDLVDLVQLEYAAGERSTVLPIETAAGRVLAGIAICFDIIFDDQAVELVRDGAEVIFAQTNNADFGDTDQSAQQLQIASLRAVETGRTVVNISTVGTSAIIEANGTVLSDLEPFTADAMVETVELRSGNTPAMSLGAVWAGFWVSAGVLSIVLSIAYAGRSRRANAARKS